MIACRVAIRDRLHDPASAEFDSNPTVYSNPQGYRVLIGVRARNAFNALRLSQMACTVTKSGTVLSVE